MEKSKIDIAVLFLFFARPTQTAAVFEQIKIARPSKLFLYQDGPRPNRQDDIENIIKCREIVEDIDWECEVNRLYQTKNYGCDPSEYIAQRWMFEHVDKGIVLEDDDVPSQSFFPFCKELLDKYENDTRINIICGMNNIDVYEDCPYSYFFAEKGSIWGWATWKRNVEQWDSEYKILDIPYYYNVLKKKFGKEADSLFKTISKHKASEREHYESILGISSYANNRLCIVPTKNMITNIGISTESTHSVADISLLPPTIRRLLYKKRYEIDFPLKHPPYVVRDMIYENALTKCMHAPFFENIYYKAKRFILRVIAKITH